mmetsp:Transcript_30106/g.82710  ORF Transcript_30106/g.82710 Transcript_30106/m.82710 type:complete len:163 (+) Transcript_30106:69-557(+)
MLRRFLTKRRQRKKEEFNEEFERWKEAQRERHQKVEDRLRLIRLIEADVSGAHGCLPYLQRFTKSPNKQQESDCLDTIEFWILHFLESLKSILEQRFTIYWYSTDFIQTSLKDIIIKFEHLAGLNSSYESSDAENLVRLALQRAETFQQLGAVDVLAVGDGE